MRMEIFSRTWETSVIMPKVLAVPHLKSYIHSIKMNSNGEKCRVGSKMTEEMEILPAKTLTELNCSA